MKRIALILMLVLAAKAQAAIALVTGNIAYTSATATATTSGAITISPTATTGQYIVVAATAGTAMNVGPISGTELIAQFSYIGSTSTIQLFALYRVNTTCSAFTVNQSAASGLTVEAAVFSATNRLRIDTLQYATGSSTALSAGPAVSSSANQLWLGAGSLRGINAATFSNAKIDAVAADNTYQVATSIGTAASERATVLWYRLVSATSTPTAIVTASASGVWTALIICLEETPAGTAGEVSYGFSQ